MNHLNDLPQRDNSHAIQEKAEAAFQNCISLSPDFFVQIESRKDYGTDYEIEAVNGSSATNARVHVQLKGSEAKLNADDTFSVSISRANLNYLLMQPHSFYACFHLPTERMLYRSAESIHREYEHSGKNWTKQKSLTAKFSRPLDVAQLSRLANLALAGAFSSRNWRVSQSSSSPKNVPLILKTAPTSVHVPEDEVLAAELVDSLYERGEDDIISAAFEQFSSVLSSDHPAMQTCYLAEINLGMAGKDVNAVRIEAAIEHLKSNLETGFYLSGSILYSIANAYSALGNEQVAIENYRKALGELPTGEYPDIVAQCYKNLGSSYERLGMSENAIDSYQSALKFDSNLGEAHHALGSYFHKEGEYEKALDHFDQAVFAQAALGKMTAVVGSRINVHFNLGDHKSAFREINSLLGEAKEEEWIWPWCARQVSHFGRVSVNNARLAVPFWEKYLKQFPECDSGKRELLLGQLYLRSNDQKIDHSYDDFKKVFETQITGIESNSAALLWDRLGHWAQDEENWHEAECCFRHAYDLEGGHYGYCLGTALNFLGRYEESLPILMPQALEIQADAMSWFQVAAAYDGLGKAEDSIAAYGKAISISRDYDLAWFNLGGVHFNNGDLKSAFEIWGQAAEMFPEHDLTAKLRKDMPAIFS